jgi:hypothetical protein
VDSDYITLLEPVESQETGVVSVRHELDSGGPITAGSAQGGIESSKNDTGIGNGIGFAFRGIGRGVPRARQILGRCR